MTLLAKLVVAGIAGLGAFLLLAPAATAEQKKPRRIIDNEGYTSLSGQALGAKSKRSLRAKSAAGAQQGPAYHMFQPDGQPLRAKPTGQKNKNESITIHGNRTETAGTQKVKVRGWDVKSKKTTTGPASGDPDQPVILGRTPNPKSGVRGASPVEGLSANPLPGGASQDQQSSNWIRVQQMHTGGGSILPSPQSSPSGRISQPSTRR